MASRKKTLQTNFAAGEIAPDLAMRQDTEQYQNGAKSLRNRRCLIGGGTVRRPATSYQSVLTANARCLDFVVDQTTRYVLAFGAGRVDAFSQDVTTGALTAAGSVTGCPWTGTIYLEMDYVQSGNTMFLVASNMRPQVLTRTGASTWSRANFTFFTGPSSRPEQPYLKLADPAVTLRPSALTGSITLTLGGTSTSYFGSNRIGEYVRYEGKACLITAVAGNGLSCTATVIEKLPDSEDLTVTDSTDFAVGDVVIGSGTGAKGVLTSIPDATHVSLVLTATLLKFKTSDTLTGPNATSAISAVASSATKSAVVDWDDQLFGANGYPSCVELHRNRLLFGGHTTAPDYLIASRIGNLYDFNVGTAADADGILESIGDAQATKIVQMHSAEQLIVLTDNGPYYVPESKTSPFTPSAFAFFPFGSPWPVTQTAKAHAFDSGVIFVSESLIVKARPTGNLSQQWNADDDVGIIGAHMLSNPTSIAVVSNFDGATERYVAFVNDDGTMAVLQLLETQKIRNMTPWDTDGDFVSCCGIGNFLYVTTQRTVNATTKYYLELFDQNVTLDLSTTYADNAAMVAGVPSRYGSTTTHVVAGTQYLGTYPPTVATLPAGPFVVGINYEAVIETLPPVVEGPEGTVAGDNMRIIEAYVHCLESQRFSLNGTSLQAYQVTDDIGLPPPNKNGPQRFQFLGWKKEPTLSITQSDPLPLKVLAIRTTVAF